MVLLEERDRLKLVTHVRWCTFGGSDWKSCTCKKLFRRVLVFESHYRRVSSILRSCQWKDERYVPTRRESLSKNWSRSALVGKRIRSKAVLGKTLLANCHIPAYIQP